MRVAIVSHRPSATNLGLVARGWNGIATELMSPRQALLTLGRGDVALGRVDVTDALDGPEDGLWALDRLVDGGVRVFNPARALLAAHDKLLTVRILRGAALPHPRTVHVRRHHEPPDLDYPAVLKPALRQLGSRRAALPRPQPTRALAQDARVPAVVPPDRRARPGADSAARL